MQPVAGLSCPIADERVARDLAKPAGKLDLGEVNKTRPELAKYADPSIRVSALHTNKTLTYFFESGIAKPRFGKEVDLAFSGEIAIHLYAEPPANP